MIGLAKHFPFKVGNTDHEIERKAKKAVLILNFTKT